MHARARISAMLSLALFATACGESPPPAAPSAAESAPPMQSAAGTASASVADLIRTASEGAHRSPGNSERNRSRNPVETLTFFGIEPGMTVVEVWPGGGTAWYTEVLAPVLGPDGTLIGAGFDPESSVGYFANAAASYAEKIESDPETYGNVRVVNYGDPASSDMAAPGTVDAVLLVRLYHNAIRGGSVDAMLADAYAALKPGGVLGVVQHRAPEDAMPEAEQRNGYVKESTVMADAARAGFELAERSEINANPNDTADHPEGVWSLSPSLRVCSSMEDGEEKDACMEEWTAIGESDRMTLKFVKPMA